MAASIKNFLIGIFVITALGIIVFMLLFLHPSVGDNGKTLRVRFTDIDKVNVGTRVTFAGRPVGEVVAIHEIPSSRTQRISRNGDVYVYELILKVDSGVELFSTDEIVLRTSGLLGERNIEINPRPLEKNQKLQRVEGEVLYAAQPPSVEDTMRELGQVSQKFQTVLDDVHDLMNSIEQQGIVAKIGESAEHILQIVSALDQPEKLKQTIDNLFNLSERAQRSWGTVEDSLHDFRRLMQRADLSWNTLDSSLQEVDRLAHRAHFSWNQVDEILRDLRTAAAGTASFTEQANALMEYTRQGKGSLGQLIVGDDLYLRLKSILHKGEVTMNDINAYGLLFHTNKRWQRLQAQRIRLLEKLSTPSEFARFFNQEMIQISTSLSRVSMLLSESGPYPSSLICNPLFAQRFADLLKRVENMEESLKMYNEQIIDQECQEIR